ncbi:MAG: hypothetical protein ACKO1L_11120, partial [Brachymonas sp.]
MDPIRKSSRHNPRASALETSLGALSPMAILNQMPGCAPYCGGAYEQIYLAVKDKLLWTTPKRLVLTASTYADRDLRKSKLAEYVWTEFYGGVFIENFLKNYDGEHKKLLLRHASDEIRHGNAFASYTGKPAPEQNGAPESIVSRDSYAAYLEWVNGDFDAFIAILHVLELRTAVILAHWFQLLESYPDDEHDVIREMMARIARDEVFHLTYTIQILHERLHGPQVAQVLKEAFLLSEASCE